MAAMPLALSLLAVLVVLQQAQQQALAQQPELQQAAQVRQAVLAD